MNYDVFNGDADGILSLVQLRLAQPREATLVTGIKRDISLLDRVDAGRGEQVTVLDISMSKNHSRLNRLLDQGAQVLYFDHHQHPDIPNHPNLTAHINTSAQVCTALLVDHYLKGRFSLWAIAAAFGDNLALVAKKRCQVMGLGNTLTKHLERLGTVLNYNGYGRNVEDLHFNPDQLFSILMGYETPYELIADKQSVYYKLCDAYDQDIQNTDKAQILCQREGIKVVLLPDERWSHRVSGVFGNQLSNQAPDTAHAVLTETADGQHYTVSVRAPQNNKRLADVLCSGFATGGGRAGAAGINALPKAQINEFIDAMARIYVEKQ